MRCVRASFEIAIRCRRHALTLARRFSVDPDAHRAAGLAPVEPGVPKDVVQTFLLRRPLHERRSRHHPRRHDRASAADDLGRGAQIREAAVRARADEDAIHRNPGKRRARYQSHVRERALHALAPGEVVLARRIGDACGDRQRILRARSPRRGWRNVVGVERHLAIENGPGIAGQRCPVGERSRPAVAFRREGPALQVGIGYLVGRDHPGARARLDGHVADRHALVHRHRADRRAVVFDRVPHSATGADPRDDREDHVLGVDAAPEPPRHGDAHDLRFSLPERLRGHHVLDLARADAEGERAEGAVRRRVRVATDQRDAGQRQSLLGPDHVDDSPPGVADTEVADVLRGGVPRERVDHALDLGVRRGRSGRGRHIMVGGREREVRTPHPAARALQPAESVRRPLVQEVPVYIEEGVSARPFGHHVSRPDLLEHRARCLLGHLVP